MIIKAADISNPSRSPFVYQKWIEGVMKEFFTQGDAERDLGLPISMNCDRKTVSVAKAQVASTARAPPPPPSPSLAALTLATRNRTPSGTRARGHAWARRGYPFRPAEYACACAGGVHHVPRRPSVQGAARVCPGAAASRSPARGQPRALRCREQVTTQTPRSAISRPGRELACTRAPAEGSQGGLPCRPLTSRGGNTPTAPPVSIVCPTRPNRRRGSPEDAAHHSHSPSVGPCGTEAGVGGCDRLTSQQLS